MEPYYQQDGITIYHGDCREILPTLDKVDLVLTDPPYGLNEKWGTKRGWSSKNINGHGRLWHGTESWDIETVPSTVALAIEKGINSIIWVGQYYQLGASGAWLIWDKCQKHTGSEAELAWTNLEQPIRVYRLSRIDAFVNRDDYKQHPTQKPIGLFIWCLGFSQGIILDPFMGSGTTLRAAKDLGRQAIGIETEEKYCEIAANRLRQGVLNF